jgi:predicted MFS family arabinose efflux permease
MALGVGGLITAELLPASLLTPMARDLNITEGMAGQTVSATAAVALVASLVIAAATRRLDRRFVLPAFSVLLTASSVLAAVAPTFTVLMLGRFLLGIAIGGFWTMAAATTIRLVPAAHVPRALAIVFGAGSVATAISTPLGSALGATLGWRGVFLLPAGLGLASAIWQFATLPSMAAKGETRMRTLLDVVRRRGVGVGLLGVLLVFVGHFAFLTYLRPFLETVTGLGVPGVSAILFVLGAAGFMGTMLSARLIGWNLHRLLALAPLLLAGAAACLVAFGGMPAATSTLVAVWGLAFGGLPVAWATWATRTVPDETETIGGIFVAATQIAITLGAAGGGVAVDSHGVRAPFVLAGVALLLASLVAMLGLRGAETDEQASA